MIKIHKIKTLLLSPGPRPPVYTGIDVDNSVYAHHAFKNNQDVFTAQQNGRFYLKLKLTANPWPTNDSLSQNGVVLQPSPVGTINLGVDLINIQNVQASHQANYTISCSNRMGTAQFPFQLNVIGDARSSSFDGYANLPSYSDLETVLSTYFYYIMHY